MDSSVFWFYEENGVPFSELDMMHTQMAFCGDFVNDPDQYGVAKQDITNTELEGFIHVWRFFGYCLGMSDQYNLCQESFQESLKRMMAMKQLVIMPAMLNYDKEAYWMAKCYCRGLLFSSAKVILTHCFRAHGLELESYQKELSWSQKFNLKIYNCFVVSENMKTVRKGLSVMGNKILRHILDL